MSRGALTATELATHRERLRALERRLTGNVSRLEAEALRPAAAPAPEPADVPAHEGDPAARDAEESVAITLLGSEEQVLAETRAALVRLDVGTFGKCEQCGREISRARLDAVPYARHCIQCARAAGGQAG